MNRKLKPIETVFDGYKFRSRLEARWAVYFSCLGVEYEYEAEGYDLGYENGFYLPDFWLPAVKTFCEVKAVALNMEERKKATMLAAQSGCPVVMLVGLPRAESFFGFDCHDGRVSVTDYILSRHKGRITGDGGGWLWCATGRTEGEPPRDEDSDYFDPYDLLAIATAKQARFEHGETPAGGARLWKI